MTPSIMSLSRSNIVIDVYYPHIIKASSLRHITYSQEYSKYSYRELHNILTMNFFVK